MLAEKHTSDDLEFRLSRQGREVFAVRDGGDIRKDTLFGNHTLLTAQTPHQGIRMHAVQACAELDDEYRFDVDSAQMNISFCTAGGATIKVHQGTGRPEEIIYGPSVCTFSYLEKGAEGSWKPVDGKCDMVTLNIVPTAFMHLWGKFGKTLPGELHPLLRGHRPEPFFMGLPISPVMQATLHSLLHCRGSGPGQCLIRECKSLELLIRLTTLLSERENMREKQIPLSATDRERLHAARELLARHMENPPSLERLARMTGLNQFKLKRGFRQAFGITPYGYLRTVRLETAHAHLQSGKMNVYEACVAVGYSSLSNFIALFKKEFGTTPGKVLQCALRASRSPAA